MTDSKINEKIAKYINKNQLLSAGWLYFFMTGLYGLRGFISATYIVFAVIYFFHAIIVLSQIFLSTKGTFSKRKEIDKIPVFIMLVSVLILSCLFGEYTFVIGFCLFMFLLFFLVFFLIKKFS